MPLAKLDFSKIMYIAKSQKLKVNPKSIHLCENKLSVTCLKHVSKQTFSKVCYKIRHFNLYKFDRFSSPQKHTMYATDPNLLPLVTLLILINIQTQSTVD